MKVEITKEYDFRDVPYISYHIGEENLVEVRPVNDRFIVYTDDLSGYESREIFRTSKQEIAESVAEAYCRGVAYAREDSEVEFKYWRQAH